MARYVSSEQKSGQAKQTVLLRSQQGRSQPYMSPTAIDDISYRWLVSTSSKNGVSKDPGSGQRSGGASLPKAPENLELTLLMGHNMNMRHGQIDSLVQDFAA